MTKKAGSGRVSALSLPGTRRSLFLSLARRCSASLSVLALLVGLLATGAANAEPRANAPASIVFASARSGDRAIWALQPGTGKVSRLTSPPKPVGVCGCRSGEFDSHPAWSADGRRLAFTRGARLYVMRANGTDVRLVRGPSGTEDFDPAWSARGRLAFIRQRPASHGSGYVHEIVSVNAAGRDTRLVGPPARYSYRSFAWAPGGRRLAFAVPYSSPRGPFVVGLFVVGSAGGKPRFLLRAAGMGELAWSPNGSTIALAASVPGAEPYDPYRLFTIRLSDRRIVQLTRVIFAKTGDGGPRWSPGGRLIAFTRTEPRRTSVHAVRPDGSGERLIADDAVGPAWSSDGRRLAFAQGVLAKNRTLTLTVIASSRGRVLSRHLLRRPNDADGLGPQAWRP